MGRLRHAGGNALGLGNRVVLVAVVLALVAGPAIGGNFLVHDHDDEGSHAHRVVVHGPTVLLHGDHHHGDTPLFPTVSGEESPGVLHLGAELQRAMRRIPAQRGLAVDAAQPLPLLVALPCNQAPALEAGSGGHRAPPRLLPSPEEPSRLEVLRI